MLELIIIAVYFLSTVAIGVVSRRKARGVDDFFVAGSPLVDYLSPT